MAIQSFVHDSLTTISNNEDFRVILRRIKASKNIAKRSSCNQSVFRKYIYSMLLFKSPRNMYLSNFLMMLFKILRMSIYILIISACKLYSKYSFYLHNHRDISSFLYHQLCDNFRLFYTWECL